MNKQVYYWCTIIVITVVVVIGWLTVSNNGNTGGNQNIVNEAEQNVGSDNKNENNTITVEEENDITNYLEDQTVAMDKMMTEMKNISKTGSVTIDFLNEMALHHESAIAMSESYFKYGGQNAKLKQMAEDIINTQTAEIERMQSMIQQLEAEGKKEETKELEYLKAYHKILEESMPSHSASTPTTVDEAFAEGMIKHHEMAVQMAETVLQYTDNEEVRHMAQNIIEMQNKEMTQMKEIINEIKYK